MALAIRLRKSHPASCASEARARPDPRFLGLLAERKLEEFRLAIARTTDEVVRLFGQIRRIVLDPSITGRAAATTPAPRSGPSTAHTRKGSRRRTSWRQERCWKPWPDVDCGAGRRIHCDMTASLRLNSARGAAALGPAEKTRG